MQATKEKPSFGQRIRLLRQERGWTQAELGKKIHIVQKQVSSYERGVNVPSADVLVKIAEAFGVTLDYLAGEGAGQRNVNIQDRELLRRFEVVAELPEQYRTFAKEMLDLLILKHRFQQLASHGPVGLMEGASA